MRSGSLVSNLGEHKSWAGGPFDGRRGGEMTSPNAADPRQVFGLSASPVQVVAWSNPCIEPVWGARVVVKRHGRQVLAKCSPPDCTKKKRTLPESCRDVLLIDHHGRPARYATVTVLATSWPPTEQDVGVPPCPSSNVPSSSRQSRRPPDLRHHLRVPIPYASTFTHPQPVFARFCGARCTATNRVKSPPSQLRLKPFLLLRGTEPPVCFL